MDRLARVLSIVFQPLVSVTAFALALAVTRPALRALDAAFWGLIVLLPGATLFVGMRRGLWTDPDISNLRERRTFLPIAAACAAALGAWALIARFPAPLRLAGTAIAVWLGVSAIVSLVWKISLHEGATVGIVLLVAAIFGRAVAAALVWAPFAVGWARVRLRHHTPAQVVAGAVAACASFAVGLALARV
jgi:hypothetical protein